jgi:hypothetical protein
MLGASLDNTAEENVIAFDMIERELMKMARKNGFSYTIAENISPLTQVCPVYHILNQTRNFQHFLVNFSLFTQLRKLQRAVKLETWKLCR